MRLQTRQDPHRCLCLGLDAGDISAFQLSIVIGVPAVWESIRKGIVAKMNSGSPISKAVLCMYIPVLAQLAMPLFCGK